MDKSIEGTRSSEGIKIENVKDGYYVGWDTISVLPNSKVTQVLEIRKDSVVLQTTEVISYDDFNQRHYNVAAGYRDELET